LETLNFLEATVGRNVGDESGKRGSVPIVAGGNQPWALFVALGVLGGLYNELEIVHGIDKGEMEMMLVVSL
jgi:hypothetical protein